MSDRPIYDPLLLYPVELPKSIIASGWGLKGKQMLLRGERLKKSRKNRNTFRSRIPLARESTGSDSHRLPSFDADERRLVQGPDREGRRRRHRPPSLLSQKCLPLPLLTPLLHYLLPTRHLPSAMPLQMSRHAVAACFDSKQMRFMATRSK